MLAQPTQKTYTIAEYLEIEEEAQIRHELINGEMIPMTGGTTNHNLVAGNIYLALRLALKGKNNLVFIENVRLFIPSHSIFTYPDVMVMAGEAIYYNESKTTVTNPIAIIEVLSNSTRNYDLGGKFEYYRTLETLQEYILVDPEKVLVMVYRRGNNKKWSLDILETLTDVVQLESVQLEIPSTDIYENVL